MAESNPVLGAIQCPMGNEAQVYQTKKRGRHFYTRCKCCGLQQGTGAERQTDIWSRAKFIADVTVVKPSNVTDSGPTPVNEPEPASEPKAAESGQASLSGATQGDFDPNAEPEDSGEREQTAGGSGWRKAAAAVGITTVAAGIGWWMS